MIEAFVLPEIAASALLSFLNGTEGDVLGTLGVLSVATLLDLIRQHGRALTDALGITPND